MKLKKTIQDVLIISVLCVIMYIIFKIIFTVLLKYAHYSNAMLRLFIYGLIITLWAYALSYKKLWTLDSLKGGLRATFFYTGMIAMIFLVMGCIKKTGEINTFYKYIMSDKKERGWRGVVHVADDSLGFRPIPGARGFHIFPIGDSIPMCYDSRGFRAPLAADTLCTPDKPVDILFLGCSCTYGDACYVEETFPYKVAKEAHLNYINAGVCSYGLSHMYLLAQKLIPKYKPKYVVIQYSPWLGTRGTSVYAPSYLGLIPNPYFTYNNNTVGLELPAFKSDVFAIDKVALREQYKGHYWKFFFGYGMPFVAKETVSDIKTKIDLFFHPAKKPATDLAAVENYAYNEIIKITNANGGKAIILKYGDDANTTFKGYPNAAFANADSSLITYLKAENKTSDIFKHWRKTTATDSVIVDGHPNFLAHNIITQTIISQIK